MPSLNFILNGRETQHTETMLESALWMGTHNTTVLVTHVGPYRVSTVFLGAESPGPNGEPGLFETMVFSDDDENFHCWRYSTYDQAELGHQRVVERFTRRWAWLTVPVLRRARRAPPAVKVIAAGPDARREFGLPRVRVAVPA